MVYLLILLTFLTTVLAQTAELQLMVGNGKAGPRGDTPVQVFIHRLVDIKDPAACLAPEMIVGFFGAFIPGNSAPDIQPGNFPAGLKHFKIPVDRSFTDTGDFFFYSLVYHIGSGVRRGFS
jgi:hypothetical protein